MKQKVAKKKSAFREYAEAIVIAVILALFIRTFVVQAFKIPSGSMIPTLAIGDHILVNKFIYGIRIPYTNIKFFPMKRPERGDIIVFIYPRDTSKDFIKRVIGVEGDRVEVRDKVIYINGEKIDDPYGHYTSNPILAANVSVRDNFGPVRVPPHSLFVMGDNRDNSQDSRFWGFVDLNAVKGKAFMIYWSWAREKHKVRWKRIGHWIH